MDMTSSAQASVRIKGSMTSVACIQLTGMDEHQLYLLQDKLDDFIDNAPALIRGMPVILEMSNCYLDSRVFAGIVSLVRRVGANPFAVRGCPEYQDLYEAQGVSYLGDQLDTQRRAAPVKSEPSVSQAPVIIETPIANEALIITTPVRSGQQIYARQRDLIIVSNVSNGAEVMSDGSIHVYGALRGRAMAGVTGNENARIFCSSMDAELLLIDGDYLIRDSIPEHVLHKPCQTFKHDQKMIIDLL
ncbi:septum site-determining protein MinC [Nitrincola alkalisediminis]|uniref:septum site-determining protein MinC n=1 Tax=Nitrincola alkalisediminis TaxID=1366656 RepID=UPI001873BBFA|nr:septum site-determining protein MinC [Nitrincola alkalisediminis]